MSLSSEGRGSQDVSPSRSSQNGDISDRVDAGLANLNASLIPGLSTNPRMHLKPGVILHTPPHGNAQRRRKIGDDDGPEFSPEMDTATMLSSIKADTAATKREVKGITTTLDLYKDTIDHQALLIQDLKEENQNLALGQKVLLGRLVRSEARADQQQAEINEMKSRMMRDNLIIKTKDKKYASTKGENTASKVKTFLKEELRVDVDDLKITRAHRMGKATEHQNAMMIAKFPYAADQKKIFSNIAALKDTDNIISKQYPAEVEERRHFAWATYKKEKSSGKDVRFDHTGQLFVDNVLQDRFNRLPLPPTSAAAVGAGAPEIPSLKSDINYAGNHAFQAFIYQVDSREDVAIARDLLYSDVEVIERASHIPYAYRLGAGQENFDSDKDYYTGTIILDQMKKLKLDGYVVFLLHNAPVGQPITMAAKRGLIEKVLQDAKAELNKPGGAGG